MGNCCEASCRFPGDQYCRRSSDRNDDKSDSTTDRLRPPSTDHGGINSSAGVFDLGIKHDLGAIRDDQGSTNGPLPVQLEAQLEYEAANEGCPNQKIWLQLNQEECRACTEEPVRDPDFDLRQQFWEQPYDCVLVQIERTSNLVPEVAEAGMVVASVNGTSTSGIQYERVLKMMEDSTRPLDLVFLAPDGKTVSRQWNGRYLGVQLGQRRDWLQIPKEGMCRRCSCSDADKENRSPRPICGEKETIVEQEIEGAREIKSEQEIKSERGR